MTQMFVANATAQFRIFHYRVAENPNLMKQTIPPGGQVRIAAKHGNLTSEDVAAIVGQDEPYGIIAAGDVGKDRVSVHGTIYSLDRPVPMPRLLAQIEYNRQVMVGFGKRSRQAAAVASNDRINAQLSDIMGRDVMQKLVVEVEQKTSAHVVNEGYHNAELARQLAEAPTIAEGIRVEDGSGPQRAPVAKPARRMRRKG